MPLRVGTKFGARVAFDPESVAAFARVTGDLNPVHQDADYAAGTRFGGPIVSGPELSARMMAQVATHFSKGAEMLGLEFSFRFRRAVPADATVDIEWKVVAVRPREGVGEIATLEGRLVGPAGEVAVSATGTALVTDAL